MPKRSSTPKKPRKKPTDVNALAAAIIAEATANEPAEAPEEQPQASSPDKNPAAVALGRLGGLKGGKARAAKLSKSRRKAIAKKAAESRWRA